MAGIYIHVPFCAKKCLYCDFFSKTDMSQKKSYINALINEIERRKLFLDNQTIETLYFGGGTPSQLEEEDLNLIFEKLNSCFDLSNCEEITIEVNPDDVNKDYIQMLNKFPFNRISLGVQSFKDSDLKFLNRRHSSMGALDAIKLIKESGYSNISLDLMYGLPGQTLEDWKENIKKAIDLNITHISAYHLIYEEGTPLYKLVEKGKIKEIEEELSLKMFITLISDLTKAGFIQYEISNFSLPGFQSKHNSSYWKGVTYLGLGPGAHSYNGKTRLSNRSDLRMYINEENYTDEEHLSEKDIFNDYILTTIRVMEGMDISDAKLRFGEEKIKHILSIAEKYIKDGKLEISDNRLRLTADGIFISDTIMSDMMIIDD